METTVKFSSVKDIEDFVAISQKYDFNIVLEMGKIKLNAKSLMGILSFELLKPVKLTAETDNAQSYFEEIHEYIAK